MAIFFYAKLKIKFVDRLEGLANHVWVPLFNVNLPYPVRMQIEPVREWLERNGWRNFEGG